MRKWIPLLLATSQLLADSIMLINDSIFPLRVEIYNAFGAKETTISLTPGQTLTWNKNLSPYNTQYDVSTSPYTVKWFCTNTQPYDYRPPPPKDKKDKNKEKESHYVSEFGSWTNVPSGATVNALASTNGTTTCVVKKKKKEPPPPNQPPPKKPPGSLGNWENDGGETWGNDNGPGWETQLQEPNQDD